MRMAPEFAIVLDAHGGSTIDSRRASSKLHRKLKELSINSQTAICRAIKVNYSKS